MLREVLDSLSIEQRRQLSYALDNEVGAVVKLPDGKFVGINIHPTPNMRVVEQVGDWTYGRYVV